MNGVRTLSIGVVAVVASGAQAALADPVTVYSEAKRLGDGFAQVYAELDADGAPRVIGVSFDQGMLAGLPNMPNTWSRCFDKNGNGRIDAHGDAMATTSSGSRCRTSWCSAHARPSSG